MVLRRILSSVMFALGVILILRSLMRYVAQKRQQKLEEDKQDLEKNE